MSRHYPSMIAPEGHCPASPAPSGQGVSGEPVAWLYEKNGKQSLQAKRQPWNTAPDRGWTETPLYAAPAPSCAPGEVDAATAVIRAHAARLGVKAITITADTAALSPQGLDAKEGGE